MKLTQEEIIILILSILLIILFSQEQYQNHKQEKEGLKCIEHGYHFTISTSTGYFCYDVNRWCGSKELDENKCDVTNYDCIIGCWKGMNYNSSEFKSVATTSIVSQNKINECKKMCSNR